MLALRGTNRGEQAGGLFRGSVGVSDLELDDLDRLSIVICFHFELARGFLLA